MRKILITLAFVMMTIVSFSQVNFMGIPVDGTKSEMISKLKQKGFSYDTKNDCLEGIFNGTKSNIWVVTNRNGKVYRIYVCDANQKNEANIINRFNTLFSQFLNKDNYRLYYGEKIKIGEDISYQMSINNKMYSASFTQFNDEYLLYIDMEYSQKNYEKVHNKAIEIVKEWDVMDGYNIAIRDYDEEEIFERDIAIVLSKVKPYNSVWFKISEFYGEYYIALFYDNLLNAPNGEDL